MQAAKILGATALALCGASSHALDIVFDYSQDAQHFFDADKRAVLEQVASIFENNLGNSLAALSKVNVSSPGMAMDYTGGLPNYIPGTALTAPRQDIAADTLLIYVGATDLPYSTLGLAWVGTANPYRVNRANNGFFNSGWGGQLIFDTTQELPGYGASARSWYLDDDIRSAEAVPATLLPLTPGGQPGRGLLRDEGRGLRQRRDARDGPYVRPAAQRQQRRCHVCQLRRRTQLLRCQRLERDERPGLAGALQQPRSLRRRGPAGARAGQLRDAAGGPG
ncbi:MAG TPA: hypothetical protein VJN44_15600, partial [Roseateles sp.]|nr:hypothetical protein [Roseateles sp.]